MATQKVNQRGIVGWLLGTVRSSLPMRYPAFGLICLAVFADLLGVGAITPIRSIYARDHGATLAELGFMASAYLLGGLIFQFPGGWASDKWGRKPLIIFGIAVSGLISFSFLLSDNPWYFIVLRFIEGAAGAAIAPAANAYVQDSVPARERGAAFGWLGSAFSAGFMLGPAVGGLMVDALGYTSPFIYGGVISLLTSAFLVWKMRDSRPGTVSEVLGTSEENAAAEAAQNKRKIPKSLFVPALIGAIAFAVAPGFADGLFLSIWSLWLNDLHASTSFIGLTFITFSLPLMLLMPFTGKMADKYRLAPLIVIPGVLISAVYLVYGFIDNLWLIALLGLLEGTFVAVMGPATSSYVANLSPDNARGRLQGIISTARTVAGFVSSILVALLYANGPLFPFMMLAGVQIVISVLAGTLVWRIERKAVRVVEAEEAALRSRKSAPVLESAAR